MRVLAVLLCLSCLSSGCKRENPAFRESIGSTSKTSGTDESTTLDESGVSTVDATTLDSSTVGTSTTDTTDTGPVSCELVAPPDVFPFFVNDVGAGLDCAGVTEASYLVTGIAGGVLEMAGPCDFDCISCDPNPISFGVQPLDLSAQMAWEPACLRIVAEGPLTVSDPAVCAFQAASIWSLADLINPLLSVSTFDWGVPGALSLAFSQTSAEFDAKPVVDAMCDCSEPMVECCDANRPPAIYKLEMADGITQVAQSESIELRLGLVDYEFENLVSLDTSDCARGRDIAWVLNRVN